MAGKENVVRACLIVDDVPVNAIYMSRAQHAAFGYEPSELPYVFGWRELERNPRFLPDELARFAGIAERFGVRGKFTYLPFPAGWGRVDERVRGYSDEELTRMNAIVRDRLDGRFDITPEVMTHTMAILPEHGALLPHAETHWISHLCRERRMDELAEYIRAAYQILHNIGIRPHGLTLGGMPDPSGIACGEPFTKGHHRDVLGEVLLAVEREFDSATGDSFVYTGAPPVADRSIRLRVPEAVYGTSGGGSESGRVFEIHSIDDPVWFLAHGRGSEALVVDRLITHDLGAGSFVEDAEHGRPLVFTVHGQTLNCLNTGLGFKVLEEILRRLDQRFGDRLQWHTARELVAAVGFDGRDAAG